MKLPRWILSTLIGTRLLKRPRFLCVDADDEPDTGDFDSFTVVREVRGGHPKWAYLKCPKCGELISLNIAGKGHWRLYVDWLHRPTINPSIWQTGSCGAHFFVRQGRIDWS